MRKRSSRIPYGVGCFLLIFMSNSIVQAVDIAGWLKEKADFKAFLAQLDNRYWDETQNPAYKLFLG